MHDLINTIGEHSSQNKANLEGTFGPHRLLSQ